jgi:hypothetical protein
VLRCEKLCCAKAGFGFGTHHSSLPVPGGEAVERNVRCDDGCTLSRSSETYFAVPRLDDIETRLAGGEKTLDFPFAISALLSSAAQRDISSRPGLPKRG